MILLQPLSIASILMLMASLFLQIHVNSLPATNSRSTKLPYTRFMTSLFASNNEELDKMSPKLPKIAPEVLQQFTLTIEEMITDMALTTSAYYMTEFHDDATKKWMLDFNQYKQCGFDKTGWKNYLESMIALNRQNITVYMDPPDGFLGTKSAGGRPKDPNIKLQYTHTLEPRKIAHQILTIREDVSGEVIADLRVLKRENAEIERFAAEWMTHGKDRAEHNRRLTRNADDEESTPMRNKNFYQSAIYITNVALDIVKHQLSKKSTLGATFLDSVLAKLDRIQSERDPLDQLLHEPKGPCALIEELYYHGITQGVHINEEGESLNVLRIAQDLMAYREALAEEACRTLADLATNSRHYYKLIKDSGGFNKFEAHARPKFQLVDLRKIKPDAEPAVPEEPPAAVSTKEPETTLTSAAVTQQEQVLYEDDNSSVANQEDVNIMDRDSFGGGPMMM